MNILWFLVYWGNFIFGSFVVKFYQYYWMSGHFSVSSKIKFAMSKLLLLLIAGLSCLAGLVALCLWLTGERFAETCYTAILIMSNAYGTLVLIVLLSYGLIFLPFAIWKASSKQKLVFKNLIQADQTYEMCRDARHDFMREVDICRALAENNRTGFNQ